MKNAVQIQQDSASLEPVVLKDAEAKPIPASDPDLDDLQGEAMEVFVRQAKAYMGIQEWEKALLACDEALAVAPNISEAHKRIGNVLQEMGRGIDSMGHYARALFANPRFPEVYANLGSLYARQQAWSDAELYYRKAIALKPDQGSFYRPLMKVLEAMGKPQEATQAFVQWLTLDPESGSAMDHYRVGNYFLDQGEEQEAIAHYRQAVELDSEFVHAYRPLADLLEKQGDWQTATLYYRKVLEAGLTLEDEAKMAAQAEAQVRGAALQQNWQQGGQGQVQRIPARPATLADLLKRSQQAQSAQAIQPVQAIQQAPQQAPVQSIQAQSAAQPVQAQPTAENFARSGQLQAQEKNWERAIEYYQRSLQLNPRQAGVYRELARALTQTKQTEQAALAWFAAFKLEPDWAKPEQHFNLGNALLKQGRLEDATVCFQQAVRLRPDFAQGYEHLGRVLELQQDPAGAAVAYRKALQVKGAEPVKK